MKNFEQGMQKRIFRLRYKIIDCNRLWQFSLLSSDQAKQNREEIDSFHQHICDAVVALASEIRLLEETPRVVGRQQHRT